VLLGNSHFSYGNKLPSTVGPWSEFAGISPLGLIVSSLLGVAFSTLAKDGKSVRLGDADRALLPDRLRRVLRLRRSAQVDAGHRRAVPPQVDGPGHAGGLAATLLRPRRSRPRFRASEGALILGAWALGGALLCRFTFRRLPKNEE
jgi:ABC-2 type transport system permease protein